MKASERKSNHELLRVIAMYMIVFIHANMYLSTFCTGAVWKVSNGFVNGICNIGVTCFILISGYYGIRFDIKKLVKMECMMITYSVLETAVLYFFIPEQLQGAALLEQLVKSLLPFITRKYWFYSCYVCLFLLSGYIQKFIERLEKKDFERLLLLMLVLFSVLPTLFYFELIPDNGKGLVQMLMIYMVGRYIQMYKDVTVSVKKVLPVFLVLWIINGISHEFPLQLGGIYHHLCKDNSITNLVMAVILFYCFKNLTIHSKVINKAASYIFAVFALNNTMVNVVMKMVQAQGFVPYENVLGFLILAGVVLLILVGCILIGVLREGIFGSLDWRIGEWVERCLSKVRV